jgi:hypothetical protein
VGAAGGSKPPNNVPRSRLMPSQAVRLKTSAHVTARRVTALVIHVPLIRCTVQAAGAQATIGRLRTVLQVIYGQEIARMSQVITAPP